MRYVELFAGAGGGILAHSFLRRHRIVAAAEKADFPAMILELRQRTGLLPQFPILRDVSTMDGKPFRGADLLAGGFPCQGLSSAGKKAWLSDPRSSLVWHMLRIADEMQVPYIFAENSPNMRTKGLHLIVPELQRMGYHQIAWCVLGADDLGAPHIRKRMWLLAKKGGPPFLHRWGDPAKIPPCGMLLGNTLHPLLKDVVLTSQKPPKTLPTLLSSDARNSGNRPNKSLWSLCDRLGITRKCHASGTLPTLAATDWKSPYSAAGLQKQLKKRSKPLRDMLPYYAGGRIINPDWAEWFMGWPPGWTDPALGSLDLTPWSQKVRRDAWWTYAEERRVLPATLLSTTSTSSHKPRITALGNGQVPAVAAAAFDGLMRLLSGV